MSDISIQLQGKSHQITSGSSIQDLLEQVGLGSKPVVVERNKIALFPRDYAKTLLESGDSIELITIAAGG